MLKLRLIEPRDREGLQGYVRSLSLKSRYNRFLGAMSELPGSVLEQLIRVGEANQYMVLATMLDSGVETIVGEACYAFHADTSSFELGLSVHDRWQGRGIGNSLVRHLESRAVSFGAEWTFGDILRSNELMIGLAFKSGYTCAESPGNWEFVRFEKKIRVGQQRDRLQSRAFRN